MATPVQILINARNQAGPAFTQLQGQLSGVDNAARVAGGGMNAMLGVFAGGAAIAGIIHAGRELQQLGIQSANTEQAFRGLAKEAGASADVMLGKLRDASRGMITDLDLMTNANRSMMLGVTSNADEMAGLLEVAATRGRALGRSTADAFTDIVTGIGRMSPLILDNLGIVTGGEKAFDAYAVTLGKTAAELTDVERKQFLVNKVLGDTSAVAAAAADSMGALSVAIQNYKAALGIALADVSGGIGLTGAINQMTDLTIITNKTMAIIREMDVSPWEAFLTSLGKQTEFGTLTSKLNEIRAAVEAGTMEMPAAIAAIESLGQAYLHGATYAGVMTRAMDEFNARTVKTATSTYGMADAMAVLEPNLHIGLTRAKELRAALEDSEPAYQGAASGASTYNAELEKLKGSIEAVINSSVAGTKSLVDFDTATGGFDANGPARDFGRMWDVAVNGFQSQWLDELRAQGLIPQDVLDAGEAALKQFAEGKAKAFQAGTDLGLLDVGAVTAQVQQQIAANAEMEKMKASILATLTGQGVGRGDAQKALGQVLGDGTSAGIDVGTGIATGIPQGLDTAGAQIATALKKSIADASDKILEAGRIIGRGLGDGLLQVFKDSVPAELVAILADLVAPEVLKRLNAGKTTTGARP